MHATHKTSDSLRKPKEVLQPAFWRNVLFPYSRSNST